MDDKSGIDVRFIHRQEQNTLMVMRCNSEAFERIRSSICAEVALPVDVEESSIRCIEIAGGLDSLPSRPPSGTLRDRIALLGCAVITAVFLTVFLIGLAAIFGWK
ncbi:MAG: hypothetical protein JW818_15490 [Pirellulales bacterium]|nr:hypothetical protein [Pirellulales bacterium]